MLCRVKNIVLLLAMLNRIDSSLKSDNFFCHPVILSDRLLLCISAILNSMSNLKIDILIAKYPFFDLRLYRAFVHQSKFEWLTMYVWIDGWVNAILCHFQQYFNDNKRLRAIVPRSVQLKGFLLSLGIESVRQHSRPGFNPPTFYNG